MKNPIVPILGIFALVQSSPGAPVTWTGPTPTVDENSISLTGTFVHAATWGDGSGAGPIGVPVGSETITFANGALGSTIGTNNAVVNGGYVYFDSNIWTPPGAANSNFDRVMDGFATAGPNPTTVILGNLIPGATYQAQFFTSDDRGCCNGRTQKWSDSASDGTGAETSVYASGTSSHVTGTFQADGTSQNFYIRGVSENSMVVNAYVLRLISAPDADNDDIPDAFELAHPGTLDPNNPNDAGENPDNDGLTNLEEYIAGTKLLVADTDGDGLTDGEEVKTYNSSPLLPDTDSDGVSDYDEAKVHLSNPRDNDSDDDNFPDAYEARAGSSLTNPASTPNGTTISILGTGTGALLGSDLTDPDNNGNDTTTFGSNFDWLNITSSNNSYFQVEGGNQAGAFDVFDNKVGNGEEKWCCAGVELGTFQHVTVEFDEVVSLSHFTITSTGDSPQRDPRQWAILGSNDGINYTPITEFDFPGQQIWTERNQVIRVNLPTNSLPFRYIRYAVYSTGSTEHSLNEIEYFGTKNGTDTDNDGMPDIYEARYSSFLNPGVAGDASADRDGDGLSNFREFELGTRPDLADTDGDGLTDFEELEQHFTTLAEADTDRDGLNDGEEIEEYLSNPFNQDSDGDRFRDGYEVSKGGNPADASVGAGAALTVLGTGDRSLLGRDVTDHDNNGVESATPNAAGFDWLNIASTAKSFFHDFGGTEGAFDIFDNKVGGGERKFYNFGLPVSVSVELPYTVKLTHFTLTSGDDAPGRDPRGWSILGSTDGVNYNPIFTMSDTPSPLWRNRNEVLRFQLPAAAPAYRYFRLSVDSTAGADVQIGELELFGIEQDSDNDGMPDYFEDTHGFNRNNNADGGLVDTDGDGLTNAQEYQYGGNPRDADTDDDGLGDAEEVTAGSKLDNKDTDFDGFSDLVEVRYGSSPTDATNIPDLLPIAWQAPQKITGAISDIKTNGTLVYAWSGGNAVNIPAISTNFQTGPLLNDRYGDFDPYNRGGDQDYESLLANGSYGNSKFIEIPNLTIGQEYQVQIWVADTRDCCRDRTYRFGTFQDDEDDPFVDLNAGDSSNLAEKPGQFVVGTFTAAQKSHFIYVSNSGGGSQYNAIMVRQISAAEPAPVVTQARFNGAAFEMTVVNLNTTKTYILRRSVDMQTFNDVGTSFVPATSERLVIDPTPPAGKAFYKVVEVSP